ncbi:helix-turn-helix domain-containing protein [Catellatospora chokoriensis]|uniref:HTH cro/C1-type domain-containing protein n=1 Tax=Catellatospora chokoriensis TaxID=310353 RepID=A0A8J3K1A9_9ACTN|nr:helix-turn-helix transcriptional regulator [Catellatospora chokoriensis]GIF92249.1 hypothetical protein Cch02nite_56930 [Catellatospora chokoriensis]
MITGTDLRAARRSADLTLEDVARVGGVSAGHLSRIESRARPVTPATIALYERVTGGLIEASGEDLPAPSVDPMHRKEALRLAGATLAASFGMTQTARDSDDAAACAQWLAWELWHRGLPWVHESEVPAELAAGAGRLVQTLQVIRSADGGLRFPHPGLVDFHIACRVYGGIATGSRNLLATAQTSHATDQVIRQFVEQDPQSTRSLAAWMASGDNAVLRVNAAGILAKVPSAAIADSVIRALRADSASRHLYLTAVAHRVLGVPWAQALALTSGSESVAAGPHAFTAQLADELRNPRDAAARWCSAVLLHDLGLTDHQSVKAAVAHALHTESARENLRTMAALLAGVNPVTT